MNPFRYLAQIVILATVLCSGLQVHAQALTKDSPFIGPQANLSSPPFGGLQLYTLVGVIGADRNTRIGILDMRTRKSVWIPIGQTIGGIEALSHNPNTDEVAVRINGSVQMLSLRMPSMSAALFPGTPPGTPLGPGPFPPGASSSAPFGVAPLGPGPFPPGTPGGAPMPPTPPPSIAQAPAGPVSNQAEQERDARMLVSDLLDIGMQQRKAFQDAQKKLQQKQVPPSPIAPSAQKK